MNHKMEEEKLIEKLNKVEDIKPMNSTFEDNLKKRLINQRQEQIASRQSSKVEHKPKQRAMFGLPMFIGFSFVIIILVGTIVYFSVPSFHTNDQSNNSADNQNEINKKPQLNIDGELILASDYELEGYWVKLRLPADWKFENTTYDVDKLEDAKFVNGDKAFVITQKLQDYSDQTTKNIQLDSVKNNNSSVKAMKVDNIELERLGGRLPYKNNYLVKVENASPVVLYSAKNEKDIAYLEAIINDMKPIDPYENWKNYNSSELEVEFKYSNTWTESNSEGKKNIWLTKNTEFKSNDYQVLVNINTNSEEYKDMKFVSKFIYGQSYKYVFDNTKLRQVYKFTNNFGEDIFAEVLIKSLENEDMINKSLFDQIFLENRKEVNLLISSIKFSYGAYEEKNIKSLNFLYSNSYVQNEVNNISDGVENVNLVNGQNNLNVVIFATQGTKNEYLDKNYQINTESVNILGHNVSVAKNEVEFEKNGYYSLNLGEYFLVVEFKGDDINTVFAEKILKSLIVSIESK